MELNSTGETASMAITLMLLLVHMGRANLVSPSQTPFLCPLECENCVLVPKPSPGIIVHCDLNRVFKRRDDLSYIQSPQIKWLILKCSEKGSHIILNEGSFTGMTKLMEVVISGCPIRDISRNLFMAQRDIQNLTINGLGFSSRLSQGWMQPMKNSLRKLDLSSNSIVRFPSEQFCGFPLLETLMLSNNRLSSSQSLGIKCSPRGAAQPPCQPCLPSLTYLDLSNNGISFLSVDFRVDLPLLQNLDISFNSLVSFLPRIDAILVGSLQSLNLNHNKLSTFLLQDFDNCNGSVLSRLDVQNNKLKYISPNFFKCFPHLEHLDLVGNSLSGDTLSKAGVSHLSKLKRLYLNNNRIDHLSSLNLENITDLIEIFCTGCGLKTIDKDIFIHAQHLEVLGLKNNNIEYIESGTFAYLERLRILDLTVNQLSMFEVNKGIPSLEQLHLGGNLLKQIPNFSGIWSSLSILDLLANNINEIQPERLSGLTQLTGLRISYNNFSYVPTYAFSNMKKLTALNLESSGIQRIENSAFKGLESLTHLKLEGNRIQDMKIYLTPLTSLQHLYLSRNYVYRIRQMDLPISLQFIDLSRNQVGFIGFEAFIKLDHLLAVNLTYNKLGDLQPSAFYVSRKVWLRPQFFLRHNWLECNCNMGWLRTINTYRHPTFRMPLVTDLDMVGCSSHIGRGRIFLLGRDPSDFLCIYPDQCLIWDCSCCYNTSCSCISYCFAECSCYKNQNMRINTMECTSRNITSPLPAKRPFLIRQLAFDDNYFPRLEASDFNNFPYLKQLLLNNSHVNYIEPFAFNHLKSLTHLYLQDNSITHVDSLTFRNVSTLEVLYLQNNSLGFIESNSLEKLTSLKVLFLHQNNLSFIDLSMFSTLESLEKLTLYDNPWECDCQFGPVFQRWLFANSETVINPRQIICSFIHPHDGSNEQGPTVAPVHPIDESTEQNLSSSVYLSNSSAEQDLTLRFYRINTTLGRKALMDVDFHFCRNGSIRTLVQHRQQYMIAGVVSICVIFVIVIVITGILYYYRLLIRVWLYNHYGIRFRLHPEDEDNDDKPYDVFIAHSEDDRDFVLDELLPNLEQGDMAYKTCVADRDWLGDQSIPQCLVASINQSKRTVLIVSEYYFDSEWCRYIFDTALYYVLNDKQLRLIVVLMKDTLGMRIEPEIQMFLKTGTYLVYEDSPWFWRKLRYYLPDNPRGGPQANIRPLDLNRGRKII